MRQLIVAFLLMGCAHGSEVEIEEVPPVEVEAKVPSKSSSVSEDFPDVTIECHIKTLSENGCIVYEFHCIGLPVRSEVVCSPPPVWPWEMPPDPVDYTAHGN